MTLYLLRHGEAEPYSDSGRDYDRKLSSEGKKQAHWIQKQLHLLSKDSSIDVLHSAAARTTETCAIATKGIKIGSIESRGDMYHATYKHLLSLLSAYEGESDQLLLVGHNNGISHLATYLLNEQIGMPTCGMVVIHLEGKKRFKLLGRGIGEKREICFPGNLFI